MQARRGGIYVSMHHYNCHAPSPPPQPRLTRPCRKLPPKLRLSRSCKQASTVCGDAPPCFVRRLKIISASAKTVRKQTACQHEGGKNTLQARQARVQAQPRLQPICHRGHPTATLGDAARDMRSLQCVAHRGEALCGALCGLADGRPRRPYAARRAARRGGALCGLTCGGPRHVEALRAVRVAQAAQLARRARRDDGALCVRGRVARLRIRLLPHIATQSWSCTINLRPGH